MNEDFDRLADVAFCLCMFPVYLVVVLLFILGMLIHGLGEYVKDIYDNDMYWGGKE